MEEGTVVITDLLNFKAFMKRNVKVADHIAANMMRKNGSNLSQIEAAMLANLVPESRNLFISYCGSTQLQPRADGLYYGLTLFDIFTKVCEFAESEKE
jgi:hypothetical protein